MTELPLVLRAADKAITKSHIARLDSTTADDELPAVLPVTAQGYAVVRGTRVTEVARETVDDR